MNRSFRYLVGGVALAVSGLTQAAIEIYNTESPELFLAVWDSRDMRFEGSGTTVIVDLGLNPYHTDWNTANLTFGDLDLSGLAGVDTSFHRYAVLGGNVNADFSTYGWFTAEAGIDLPTALPDTFDVDFNLQRMGNVVRRHNEIATEENATTVLSSGQGSINLGNVAPNVYQGRLATFNSGTPAINNNAPIGTALAFYMSGFGLNDAGDGVASYYEAYAGVWNLTGNTLTYGGGQAPIPLPAGIWLLGSALLGLVGVSRRRAAAAA